MADKKNRGALSQRTPTPGNPYGYGGPGHKISESGEDQGHDIGKNKVSKPFPKSGPEPVLDKVFRTPHKDHKEH